MKQRRILYIDVIKIIACFLVIVNHTNSRIFLSGSPSATWIASLTYFFISKPAVPLFILTSGAMVLNKDYSYKDVFLKILRVIAVLFVFSLLYYFVFQETNWTTFKSFLVHLPTTPITNAYWYLYLYLGLWILFPILNKLAGGMDKKTFWYLTSLTLILGMAPIVLHYVPAIDLDDKLQSINIAAYVVTFLAGFYLHHQCQLKTKKSVVISAFAIAGIILALLAATYIEYLHDPKYYLFFSNKNSPLILVMAGLIFLLIKYIFSRIQIGDKGTKVITALGNATFGIYLLSDLFIYKFEYILDSINGAFPPMAAIVLFQLAVFGAGFLITYLLRKIPFVAKFI